MIEGTVRHATIVAERRLGASPDRVFRAWAAERGEWDVPKDEWGMAKQQDDVRVDGVQYTRFGPSEDPRFEARGRYLVVEQNRLLILAGVMHDGGRPMTATMTTIDITPDGCGTRLVLTDQSAFFGGETREDRSSGWGIILDRLETHLSRGN